MSLIFRAVRSDSELLELSDIMYKGEWQYEPALEIKVDPKDKKEGHEYFWDNSEYLLKLYKKLKKNKKNSLHYTDFKQFCKLNDLNFKELKKEYIELIEDSKTINMWEPKENNNG